MWFGALSKESHHIKTAFKNTRLTDGRCHMWCFSNQENTWATRYICPEKHAIRQLQNKTQQVQQKQNGSLHAPPSGALQPGLVIQLSIFTNSLPNSNLFFFFFSPQKRTVSQNILPGNSNTPLRRHRSAISLSATDISCYAYRVSSHT